MPPVNSQKIETLINSELGVNKGENGKKLWNILLCESDKPWINEKGSLKSDEEIKQESQSWTLKDWDNYLETIDKDSAELLLDDPFHIDNFSNENYGRAIFSTANNFEELPNIRKKIFEALALLTPQENKVITQRYWKCLSRKEIAKQLGVSENTVKTQIRTGMKKLKSNLSRDLFF